MSPSLEQAAALVVVLVVPLVVERDLGLEVAINSWSSGNVCLMDDGMCTGSLFLFLLSLCVQAVS